MVYCTIYSHPCSNSGEFWSATVKASRVFELTYCRQFIEKLATLQEVFTMKLNPWRTIRNIIIFICSLNIFHLVHLSVSAASCSEPNVIEGDILSDKRPSRGRRAATSLVKKLWDDGVIPYEIEENFSNETVKWIRAAMDHWQSYTCLDFVKRTTQKDYIYIYSGKGCCSYVGRRGGKQRLSLGLGCDSFGIIVHELGHAVGFWHEQSRPDRDNYVKILYENVHPRDRHNFNKMGKHQVNSLEQRYDFHSIMHYGSNFFAKKQGLDTILPKLRGVKKEDLGKQYFSRYSSALSDQDIIQTNLMYRCNVFNGNGGTIFAQSGRFHSPNYPSPYPVSGDRVWIVTTKTTPKTSLTLTFDTFSVGNNDGTGICKDDYLDIRRGKGFLSKYLIQLCGNEKPDPLTVLSESIYVRLHSQLPVHKSVQQKKGFSIRFKTDETEPSQDQRWISLTELSDDAMSNSKLQELRKQYLATTAQLKEDLKQHAIETRKNAAKALRTEVLKERHATAKRLRKYYLECLKQILDDDKEAFKNDQNPRSKEEKIRIMEDRLRLPDEKDEMIKSQDSTLTNVTSLTGGNSEQYPITAQDQNPGISETTHSDPSSRRQLPNMNQDHHALQNISRDSRLQSGHPSFTTAYVNRPKQVPGGHGREQRGGEWVNYSRGDKHGGSTNFAFDDREGHSTKNSSKDVNGANLRGSPASSTESLYSFNRDQQIDLPQVMNFSQQEIPAHLLQSDQDEDTDSSCSSGISETSKDYTRTDEDNRSERYRRKGQKRDVRFYEDERTRNSRIAKGSHTQNKLSSSRTTDRTFLRPLIGTRTGNELPTKLTSSLPKPIGDVLPSKPLSPVNRVAPKFSYTMHSNSRNPNN